MKQTNTKEIISIFKHFKPNDVFAYLLNLPAIILIITLIIFPVGRSFIISLQRYNLQEPDRIGFLGFENYQTILTGTEFWSALRITAIFVFLSVGLILIIGLLLALLVNEVFPGQGILRALILLPWAVPPVVNGILWQWIYNGRVGALNGLLYDLGLISTYRSWLVDPDISLFMIIIAHIWQNVPLAVIILLAGLQAIPQEMYDAAKVDRAGIIQRFRHITLPWILNPILIVVVFETMLALKAFDIIFVLTGGGPGRATTVIAWLIYETSFKFLKFGLGNAYAFILALITLALSVIYIRALFFKGKIQ